MSICKNVFRLNKTFDLINSGCWPTYCDKYDPYDVYVVGTDQSVGNLGLNTSSGSVSSPVQLPGRWIWLESDTSSLAIKCESSGLTLWGWGNNNNGQLGNSSVVNPSSPVQIPGTQWCAAVTTLHSLGLKTDGTLWAWGRNIGTLGQGTAIPGTTPTSSPVQIPGTQWVESSIVSSVTSYGRKADGTLWSWGNGESGQLGGGTLVPTRSSPGAVIGTGSWICIANGTGGCRLLFGIKSDNSLWAFGDGTNGGLGTNLVASISCSPTQVPGSWRAVDVGGQGTVVGIKTDNTLWMWGANTCGQLGDGTSVNRSSPVQIPGANWRDIRLSTNSTAATKNDDTLWTWGTNINGALASNNRIPRSSPVQVPGTWWKPVGGGTNILHFAKKV